MQLPRGQQDRSEAAPIATARWALSREITPYTYEPGDIWLGLLPTAYRDASTVISELGDLRAELIGAHAIQAEWRRQQIDAVDAHIAALHATDTVPIGVRDDRHLLSIGSTRAGKGTSVIVPNLCLYPGSLICIDPKGENARITASRRGYGSKHCEGMGQTVCVLDPYNTTKLPPDMKAGWNPLDLLEMDDDLLIDRAAAIADALIVSSKKEDAHFDESARIFIKALVLFVAHNFEGRPQRNLITVHDLLTRGAAEQLAADRQAGDLDIADDMDAFTYLLLLMQSQDACDGVISGAATMVLGMGDRERGAVLSTARRNLEFIERRPMKRVLRASSFDIDQLKRDPKGMSLYLCLPPQRMGDCGRWLRLMITSCLERLYELEEAPATGHPVLFLLEEFASLKHLEVLEHAAGYAAGFGVKLWVILQDLPQLKRLYPDSWETFVGNAGVIQAFANGDATTLEYLSKKLGETEVAQLVSNTNTSLTAATNDPGVYHRMQSVIAARGQFAPLSGMFGFFADPQSTSQSASTSTSQNEQIQRSPLLLPDEVERMFRREAMNELVHVKGERPFVLRRSPYHVEARFAGLFDPLPGIFGRMEAPERADPQQRP